MGLSTQQAEKKLDKMIQAAQEQQSGRSEATGSQNIVIVHAVLIGIMPEQTYLMGF